MTHAGLVWANLRRRPLHNLMGLACNTLAFTLFGLAMGVAESFRRASLAHGVAVGQQLLPGAMAVSALGMTLILFLTINAMGHAVRLRLHEFGVLKALGFSARRIIALVVAEAAASCVGGAALGLIAAKLLFAALAALLPPLAVLPSPVYTPAIVATSFAMALLIALLSSVLPALRIARIDVATALTGGAQATAPRRDADKDVGRRRIATSASLSDKGAGAIGSPGLNLLRQILVVTRIGLSTLRQRIRGALLISVGAGCVAFVLLSFLSLAEGIRTAVMKSGDPSIVVVRSASTAWLHQGNLPDEVARIAAAGPGVARAADGSVLAEAELFSCCAGPLTKRNDGKLGATMIVGVGPHWREMRPSFRLLSGRMPQPGHRELIAGNLARSKYSSLDMNTAPYKGTQWRVVGTFTTGDWWNGYLVGDVEEVKTYGNHPADSAVRVRLTSPEAFELFRSAVATALPSSVAIDRESDYYAAFWRSLPKTVIYTAYLLACLIAAGVVGGTTQVMHSAMEERRREIATLRALGFDSRAVAASVVLEAMLLAAVGVLVAAGLVWLWLDGFLFEGAWSVFRVIVNLKLLLMGLGWGLAIALVGTLPLAFRTIRQSTIDALHSLCVPHATIVSSAWRPLPVT